MSTLIADVRYSVRSLLKNAGLTAAAVLSLGVGIGANTTIFTWVQAVLFRPIPVAADPASIARMCADYGTPRHSTNSPVQ